MKIHELNTVRNSFEKTQLVLLGRDFLLACVHFVAESRSDSATLDAAQPRRSTVVGELPPRRFEFVELGQLALQECLAG